MKKKANIEYIGEPSYGRCTPFLSACGALECLRFNKIDSPSTIDSMEMEAVKIVKYLKRKGADVYALNVDRRNGLHLAAKGGRDKMIPILVDYGLDINLRDSTIVKSTPLVMAIISGDLPTVKAIVKAGANINQSTARENSPLDWAVGCASGNTENYSYHDQQAIVEYLISKGAKHGKNDFTNWMQF